MIELAIKLVVLILFTVWTVYIVPVLKEKNLYRYVKMFVEAAQQMFEDTKKSTANPQKFQYVKTEVQKKFKISDEDLKPIIESEVYKLKQNSDKA